MSTIQLNYADGDVAQFDGKPGELLLDAIRASKTEFVYDCMEGQCKTCIARLTAGTVRQADGLIFDGTTTPNILCCQCVLEDGFAALTVEYRRIDVLPARDRKLTIVSIARLSHHCFKLVLDCQSALRFLPGQYMRLKVPGTTETRAYSIANRPNGKRIELLIRHITGGAMTQYLESAAKPGDAMIGLGPLGSFFLRAKPQPRLFVAGGTGLAPVFSMLTQLAHVNDVAPIRLAFGLSRASDIFYLEEIDQLRASLINFDYVISVLDVADTGVFKAGNVVDAIPSDWKELMAEGAAYLCGPPGMVDATIRTLTQAGICASSIYSEEFMPSH